MGAARSQPSGVGPSDLTAGLNAERSAAGAPLAIDLCCGLGGWTEGLLAEGYRVRGYDIEAHVYGDERYPAELVLKSILDLHGSEIADAALIVASPPCQEFSYMAMPWSRAKQIARALRGEDVFPDGYRGSRTLADLTALFDACFRIQREASQAAGRHIPMVVENVKGAQPWVGRAPWSFGSYYLWGDIPALMPARTRAATKVPGMDWSKFGEPGYKAVTFNDEAVRQMADEGLKNPGFRFDGSGKSFQSESVKNHVEGRKNAGGSWFNIGSPGQTEVGKNPVHAIAAEGVKAPGGGDGYERSHPQAFGWKAPNTTSKGKARKAASAKIAKIPAALSQHIARVYKPALAEAA